MRRIELVSIGGFQISLDFSWFIIFFLILWTLAGLEFPRQFPELSGEIHLAMGVVGTLLFFASLLFHELSHSVVARAKGIDVEGITLFVFGGMAQTKAEAESPGDEFQIAGIGPLSSLFLAALFWGIAVLGRSAGWPDAVLGVADYLAIINLALAIFNLLPGFPLDGGRLFRAAVWKATDDVRRATRVAATGGRWLGYGLMALGFLAAFMGGQLIGGLWFIFIGWFLNNAAQSSYRQLLLRGVLEGVAAREAMTASPETVPPDLSLDELVNDFFLRRRFSSFPVTGRDGEVRGLIALSQVKEISRERWGELRVADVMTPVDEMVVVRPETSMTDVLERLRESDVRRVLVAESGDLRGIISAGDITGWLERARLVE